MADHFWDDNAKNWAKTIQMKTIASRAVTNRAITEAITQHKVASLLDVGCGEGWLASSLHFLNLDYLGIDGSRELVEIARETQKMNFEPVTYDDILNGKWKASKQFDSVCFNFALFAEKVSPLLKTVSSFMKPDGLMFIQTLHPSSLTPYEDGWRVENFEAMKIPFQGSMNWYGRTLESWVKEFEEAGLVVESKIEPMNGEAPASIIFILRKAHDGQ